MQSKILLKWLLVAVIIVGISFSMVLVYDLIYQSQIPSQNRIILPPQNINAFPEEASSELPIRLIIPKISVDATIEYVGLTSEGAMDVPKGPSNPGWFRLGPRPGENGSAVIAGHYGWKDNIPAVFDHLSALSKGDKLYVVDGKGATTTFVVGEIRNYDENANAPDVFASNDAKSHLNLITCEGKWNKSEKSYSSRLVVFTDKENVAKEN